MEDIVGTRGKIIKVLEVLDNGDSMVEVKTTSSESFEAMADNRDIARLGASEFDFILATGTVNHNETVKRIIISIIH